MNLTDAQLLEIQELAGLFLTSDEIAILMDIDIDQFVSVIASQKGPVFKAYFRGKTESKKQIRQNVVKMAKHGSPAAEEMVDNYILAQRNYEKRRQ
jgi:hypothetical protein